MHELICRDRYLLDSTQAGMWVREPYADIQEAEVVKEWWGEHAPPDLAAMLVMWINDNDSLTLGANLSNDEAFDTRLSADITWRFGTNGSSGTGALKTDTVIEALTSMPSNRHVRVAAMYKYDQHNEYNKYTEAYMFYGNSFE